MKLIKPDLISGEILNILEEAREYVILVSPYCKISKWYKFTKKIKLLQERKIDIKIFVRKSEFETIDEIKLLGIEPILVENLHAKMYLNETSAIITSMNLLLSSEINSLEIAHKTTEIDEFNDILKYCNQYLNKTTELKLYNDIFNKTNSIEYLIAIHLPKAKINYIENKLTIKLLHSNYECFIHQNDKTRKRNLRMNANLNDAEFLNFKLAKNAIEHRNSIKLDNIISEVRYFDTVWGTLLENIKSQSIDYIQETEIEVIANKMIRFIEEIENIKNSH